MRRLLSLAILFIFTENERKIDIQRSGHITIAMHHFAVPVGSGVGVGVRV